MLLWGVPPDRGRSHETHANGEGCGACGFGLVSRASGGLGRHRPAQLCGSVRQRAGGADESGGNPVESRAFVNGRPCPFPEGGPGDEGKRRGGAPIGAPVRVMGRPFPSAEGTGPIARSGHRVRRSAPAPVGASPPRTGAAYSQRRPGARSPGTMEHGPTIISTKPAARVPHRSLNRTTRKRGQHFGGTNPRKGRRPFWRNEPEVFAPHQTAINPPMLRLPRRVAPL